MKTLSCICCSVLRREIESFFSRDYPEAELVILDSRLHMYPQKLRQTIDEALDGRTDHHCLLVYGECHAHMRETEQRPNCTRVNAINCGELLLGPKPYRICRNNKVFLFLPEWTERWREIFQEELGLSDQQLAREFMQENQKKFVYLDTGLIPIPERTLEEISTFFAMPIEIVAVSLDRLRQTVRSAVERMEARTTDER